jgi:adenosylhomocysteinase
VTGSNPYSTNDAVCAALADEGAEVFAIHGATMGETHEFWQEVLKVKPDLVIDDGADLINLLLGEHQADAIHLIGACE